MPGFPEVGLQAVLEGTGQFERDAASVSGSVTTLGNTVLKTAGIAAGIGVGAVVALGGAFAGLAQQALGPIGDFEKLSASMASMVAREIQAGDATLSFDEALAQAGPRAKELIDWTERLAVASPFGAEDVAASLRMAMAFGLNTERAQELTEAEINWAAATGKGGDQMQRVSFALGKMNTQGKLNGEILMQLAEAGVPANTILKEMGYTAEDASKGLVPVDKFMTAVIADFNKFGSAAQAQANTWPGLINSLQDLKNIALREFFTGTFEAIKPYVVDFVTMLQDPGVRKWLKETGDLIGKTIANGIQSVIGYIKEAKTWLDGFIPMILEVAQDLDFGADIEWHDYFPPWLADTVEWLIANLPAVKGALEGIGAVLLGAAGVAAVVALGGALVGLLNPITLLLAAGAALGVAWETNWMGMRDILTEFWENQARPALEDLSDWLKVNVPKAVDALVKFWEKDLLPALLKFSDWVQTTGIPAAKDFAKWVTTKLVPALKDLIKWIESKLVPVLADLAKSLGKAQAALSDTSKEMTKTGGTFDKLAEFWAKNGDKIKRTTGDVFDYVVSQIKSKLQVAQDTVAIISDVMAGDWGDAWKRMQSLLDNALNTITLGITGKMKEIGQTIGKALAGILSDWQGSWSKMLGAVGDALNRISQTIGSALNDFAKRISDAASSLYNAAVTMMSGLISGVAAQASAFTAKVVSVVQGAVNSLLTSVTSGSLYATLRSVGQSVITVIQGAITSVTSLGQTLVNTVANAVASLVSSVVSGGLSSTLRSVGQTIVNLISAAVSTVTSLAAALIGRVSSAISDTVNAIASGALFNRLRGIGQDMVDGIVQGMEDNADALAEKFNDIINAAVEAAKDALGIGSPSKVTQAIGASMVEGLRLGLAGQIPSLAPALNASLSGLVLAPSLVAGPGLGGGGGGSTVNNVFNLGQNNISNGMDAAVFEARVLAVIRKNLR